MSASSEESSSPTRRFRDALPSILTKSRHSEIWGVDLKHAESHLVDVILEKFLERHSANPGLQVSRASASLEKALERRRLSDQGALLNETASIFQDLGLCHITLEKKQYVSWVVIDDRILKGYSAIHPSLSSSHGLVKLGRAMMEKLSILLHSAFRSDYSAACVIEFKTQPFQNIKKGYWSYHQTLRNALEELAILIQHHYPNILTAAYIINPLDEFLACLDIDEALLRNTVLLKNPDDLAQYLGSQIPSHYGGNAESFAESDLLHSGCLVRDTEEKTRLEAPGTNTATDSDIENTGANEENAVSATDTCGSGPDQLETEEQAPRLTWSETIGFPSIILDPADLPNAEKINDRVAFADSDMVVKYGDDIRLAEAEALHLVSTRTSIPAPKLLSAYILDGIGYIVMSYEEGVSLNNYWDRASETEQARILEQLRDYVNQMQAIPGEFIGGVDRSPCRDGIFEAGHGDYTRYTYGPYPSEESFNEGIVQALRDRFPPRTLDNEHDFESSFFNSEYRLYQTVRELKNHKIVFTHGDLHPGNMVVRDDGTVVLLDWGLAGFRPEYWEFYRAMFNPPWRNSWDRMVEKFIPPFYVEYSVLNRVFATVWN